ncbi:MAG: hypothetical protein FWC27_12455, partial [Firmicutes bacterium]|nr:hypothetical protein [Bacillota bacterium]
MPFVPLWIFFGDCLPGVEFPAETQALLVQPEIDLARRRMRLEFTSEKRISPDTVDKLCRNIAEATNCDVTHTIHPPPPAEAPPSAEGGYLCAPEKPRTPAAK